MSRPCPCGRLEHGEVLDYGSCCGPLHRREAQAETAEDLMRSRFSAFHLGEVDYLLATHLPETDLADSDAQARSRLRASIEKTQWIRLEIVDVAAGGSRDSHGEVEFIATFLENETPEDRTPQTLRERSTFRRHLGRWVYVSGTPHIQPIDLRTIGRNAPCWCGSGKKRKACHR